MATNTKVSTVRYNVRYVVWNTTLAAKTKLTSAIMTLLRTRLGNGLPHFKALIRAHVSATTDMDATFQSLDSQGFVGGNVSYKWDPTNGWNSQTVQVERLSGDLIGYLQVNPPAISAWVGNAQGRAANAFLGKVRQTQTRWSAPTFIGQLREAQRMLRRPAGALWDNLLGYEAALRKRKRQNPKRWFYSIPDLWLEWSFGWRPLMMDIDGAFQALNSLLDQEYVIPVSASAVDAQLVSQTNGESTAVGSNYLFYRWSKLRREQIIVRYKGAVTVQAATTWQDRWARWGFTTTEFLPTAWELLPWSFLVDYFVTIGDAIDASGARTSGLRWTNQTSRRKMTLVCTSFFDDEKVRSTIPAKNLVAAYATGNQPAVSVYTSKRVLRTAVSPSTICPDIVIRWDGPRWGQIANMSALLGSFQANLHFQNPRRFNYRLRGSG